MRRHNFTLPCLGLALLAFFASCGGGVDHHSTNFDRYAQNMAENPVDDADPVPIDTIDFDFSEDPHAFDALFQ